MERWCRECGDESVPENLSDPCLQCGGRNLEPSGCGEEWRLDRCPFCQLDFAGLGDFPCAKVDCRARRWHRLDCPSCNRPGRKHRESDFVPGDPPEPPAGALGAALLQVTEVAAMIETDQDGVLSQAGLRAFLDETGLRRRSAARRLWHALVTLYGRERRRAIADRPKPKPKKDRSDGGREMRPARRIPRRR